MAKKSPKVAKKKAPSAGDNANHSRNPRKEGYDSRRLGRIVERLQEQAARIAALAQQMREDSVSRVEVDGHAMLLRGLNQIDNFADNASRAIREANRAKQSI